MIKFLLVLIFLIPLRFIKKGFWLNQYFYFIIIFIYCFIFCRNYQFSYLSYFIGCDLLSFIMVILSFWICSLIILASQKIFRIIYYYKLFLLVIGFLVISLYLTFRRINLFIFYLFFEVSLIPTLILIIGWGYQPERLQAGSYLLFYTLFASLPIIIAIFYYYQIFNRLDFFFISDFNNSIYIYICVNIVFFIKIPIYFVHLWLPKAHVEAPVSGSIILAGVILKLGGYGLIRFIIIFITVGIKINYIFIIIRIVGRIYVSLICLRQVDIKALIAYSSVSHIGLVLRGIITMNYWGMSGALVIIIAHGLCSSGLFCLANILYERTNSRRFFLNKGLINLIPIIALWWFLFRCCNIAAPPSLNLLGEIILINRLIRWRNLLIFCIIFISFFRAAYSLYLYSYTQHGKIFIGFYAFSRGNVREYLLLLLHWLPLNLIILKSEFVVLWL